MNNYLNIFEILKGKKASKTSHKIGYIIYSKHRVNPFYQFFMPTTGTFTPKERKSVLKINEIDTYNSTSYHCAYRKYLTI